MAKTYMGVDPGETTGIFLEGGGAVGHMQPREWDALHVFHDMLHLWRPDVVVIEQFNIHEDRTKLAGTDVQWPLDVIGAVKWECMQATWDLAVVGQWNYQRKKVTDDMLEERGWLAKPVTVMRHANDAARHVLRYALNEERRNR